MGAAAGAAVRRPTRPADWVPPAGGVREVIEQLGIRVATVEEAAAVITGYAMPPLQQPAPPLPPPAASPIQASMSGGQRFFHKPPKAFPKQEQWDGSKATGEAFEGNVRGWKAVNVQHPDANSLLAQDPVWLLGVLSSTAAVPASPFASWEWKHGDAVRARHKEDWLAAGGSVAAYRGQALLGAGGKEAVPHLVEYWVEQALAAMRGSWVAALAQLRAFQLLPGEEALQAWHRFTTLARRVPAELATPVEQGQFFLKAIHPD